MVHHIATGRPDDAARAHDQHLLRRWPSTRALRARDTVATSGHPVDSHGLGATASVWHGRVRPLDARVPLVTPISSRHLFLVSSRRHYRAVVAAHARICLRRRDHRSAASPKLTDSTALVRKTPSPKRHARARVRFDSIESFCVFVAATVVVIVDPRFTPSRLIFGRVQLTVIN